MLHFIIGSAKADKSKEIYNLIQQNLKEDDCKNTVFVPLQKSFDTEKKLLFTLGNENAHKVKVLSFNKMYNELFSEFNIKKKPILDSLVEQTYLYNTINNYFVKTKNENNISSSLIESKIKEVSDFMTELSVSNLSIENLENIKSNFDEHMQNKCDFIIDVVKDFNSKIQQKFTHKNEISAKILELLDKNQNIYQNQNIYFDLFDYFSVPDFNLIKTLIKRSKNAYITLLLPYEITEKNALNPLDDFDKINLLFIKQDEILKNLYNFASENKIETKITYIKDEKKQDKAYFIKVKNLAFECENAAKIIKDLAKNPDFSYDDVTIALTDLSSYKSILTKTLERENIPFHIDDTDKLSDFALYRFVISAINLMKNKFDLVSMINLVKSGIFSDFSLDEINYLTNYIIQYDIKGSEIYKPFYKNIIKLADFDYDLEKLNLTREKLIEPIIKLNKDKSFDYPALFYNFMIDCKADISVKNEAFKLKQLNLFEERRVLLALYKEILKALKTIDSLEEKLSLDDFCKLFTLLLKNIKVSTVSSCLDEVKIMTMSSQKIDKTKYLFMLGLVKENIESKASSFALFTSFERKKLASLDFVLDSDELVSITHDEYSVYKVINSFTEKIYAFSPLYTLLGEKNHEYLEIFDYLSSLEEAEFNDENNDDTNLENVIVTSFLSPSIPFIQTKNYVTSASSLESYSSCPFSFYLEKALKIKDLQKAQINSALAGSFMHFILENFFNKKLNEALEKNKNYLKQNDFDFSYIDKNELLSYKDKYVKEEFLCEDELSITDKITLNNTLRSAKHALNFLLDELNFSLFSFKQAETDFGFSSSKLKSPSFQISDDLSISLHGKIDRIDEFFDEKSQQNYIRIIDYKSSEHSVCAENIIKGVDLQSFLYAYIIKNAKKGSKIASSLYLNTFFDSSKDGKKYNKFSGIFLDESLSFTKNHETKAFDFMNVRFVSNAYKANSGSLVLTNEQIDSLCLSLEDSIKNIGKNLKNNNFNPNPVKTNNILPCTYCKYKNICTSKCIEDESDF